MRPLMGNRIYGCDDCLAVCPWNKFAQAGREAKLSARAALASEASGQRGGSIVRAPDTRPEPGSSARSGTAGGAHEDLSPERGRSDGGGRVGGNAIRTEMNAKLKDLIERVDTW